VLDWVKWFSAQRDIAFHYTRRKMAKPSALIDTRVIYCGHTLGPLRELLNACARRLHRFSVVLAQ